MKQELLKYICAPGTYNPLELVSEQTEGDEVITGKLIDSKTRREYPILKGIPRFVTTKQEVTSNYSASFGHQWTTYNWLRDEDQFEFETITDHHIGDFAGKSVLDVGCGGGRIARFLAPQTGIYIGADYSIAPEKAFELCRNVPQAHFVQADVNNLPFRPQPTFDFVFSHGVLHHTKNTKRSFANLPPLVKPGGEMYIAVFRQAFLPLRVSDGLIRSIVNRLPVATQEKFCKALLKLQQIPRASFWKRIFWFSLQKDPEVAACCNYDWYAPTFHHEHTAVEVMNWFNEYGFEQIRYIDAWPYCPPRDKYRIPTMKHSFRLGLLLGVLGQKGLNDAA